MFYKKTLSARKTTEKEFEFDMFGSSQNLEEDSTQLKVGEPRQVFNFISSDGTLKSGYGFKKIAMPTSTDNLEQEEVISLTGNEIKSIWKLKWNRNGTDENRYYLFYFNDNKNVCYDNIFAPRYSSFVITTKYTETPYATYYRYNDQDSILLSGEGDNLTIINAQNNYTIENTPKIVSCCVHYGKIYAITPDTRGKLIYSDNSDITQWSTSKTENLDFSDGRGDLNRIISFNDYLYIFRDFGITKISQYGKEELYEICHIYQSDSYINPNTISETGDEIYFLEGEKIKCFNGSSVKLIDVDCIKLLHGCDNRYAYGECFNGKYFLACRGNFEDDKKIGCESYSEGYKNNLLLIYDTQSKHIDIVRGVDINKLLALTNRYKSKLIACFYNENKDKIGELTTDGKLFNAENIGFWESGKTDFGYSGKLKRIKSFCIKSENDCEITFTSDRTEKKFKIKGGQEVQRVRANVLGNQFVVKIECRQDKNVYISNFVLTVSCG